MYFAEISRPDIMFATTRLARYNSGYGIKRWEAARNIARYIYVTIVQGTEVQGQRKQNNGLYRH